MTTPPVAHYWLSDPITRAPRGACNRRRKRGEVIRVVVDPKKVECKRCKAWLKKRGWL